MGPLELGDFIGLDICLAIMDVLYNETGDSKYRACPLLRKMVRGGNLGCCLLYTSYLCQPHIHGSGKKYKHGLLQDP